MHGVSELETLVFQKSELETLVFQKQTTLTVKKVMDI